MLQNIREYGVELGRQSHLIAGVIVLARATRNRNGVKLVGIDTKGQRKADDVGIDARIHPQVGGRGGRSAQQCRSI